MAHRPADVARITGISTSTVQNWTRWHGEYLSDDANPPPGRPRIFDDHDVAVLKAIAELRNQGLTTEEVNERLGTMTIPTVMNEPEESTTALSASGDISAPLAELLPVIERLSNELASNTEVRQEVHQVRQQMHDQDTRVRRLERFSTTQTAIIIVLAVALVVLGVLLAVAYMA